MKLGIRQDKLGFAGLLAVSMVGVFQLGSLSSLNIAQSIALHCLAVAVPALSMSVFVLDTAGHYNKVPNFWYVTALYMVASLTALVGLACVFWGFSSIVGALFLVTGIVGFWVWDAYDKAASRLNQETE